MPGSDDAADGRIAVRSRRRRIWLLSFAAVAAGCFGVLKLQDPVGTPAQRYVSQVSVRGYERVHDYIDPGTAPAEVRAAVAIFVGPPDDDALARVSGPGLVVSAPTKDPDFRGFQLIGHGEWHGCFVHVKRWMTSQPRFSYYELTADERAAFETGRLSVLSIAVGCGDG
ncbi:hypothetical protein ACN26Z_05100 [Verrucosispora sp. WMMD703]|uniref:hypothetical protein n=1 Tax=Verrucosispora sp. WMMD703 TaxID=3403463 RepID=UPI003B941B03